MTQPPGPNDPGPAPQDPYGAPPPPPPGQPYGQPYNQPYGQHYGTPAVGIPAGMGRRFLGRFVDGLIGVAIGAALALPLGVMAAGGRRGSGAQIGLELVTYAVWAAYEIWLVGSRGQTLGMMVAGIRVVNADTGSRPDFGSSAIRWVVLAGGFFLCFLPGVVCCLSPLFDSSGRQQGWHDKASRTMAVRT